MDPVTLGIAAVGIGISAYGAYEKGKGAAAQTAAQVGEIKGEMQANALRRQMMEMSARREGMELMRNAQRARSLALAGAAQHGAQYGSGLQGGYGQISGATNTQGLKINQDLGAGENMFDIQNMISQYKIQYAEAGGQVNIGSGLMDIGKAVAGSAEQGGKLLKQGYQTYQDVSSFSPFASQGFYG